MNDPINITEVSVRLDYNGNPVASMKLDNGDTILAEMTPDTYANYQALVGEWCAAGRRLLDEIKED